MTSSYSRTKENIAEAFENECCFADNDCGLKNGICEITKIGKDIKIENGKELWNNGWYINFKCTTCGFVREYYYIRHCKYCKTWMPSEGECEDECYEKEKRALSKEAN